MINQLLKQVLLQNELGGNKSLAYKLSLAHGGKSGPSFGVSQFDIANNQYGKNLLRRICKDIPDVLDKYLSNGFAFGWDRVDQVLVDRISKEIRLNSELVDLADEKQVNDLLQYCYSVCNLPKDPNLSSFQKEVIIVLADTVNQFGNGVSGIHKDSGTVILCKDFLGRDSVIPGEFIEAMRARKLSWKWGKKEPHDVNRRLNNILDVMNIDFTGDAVSVDDSADEPITRDSASWILGEE